MLHDMRRGAGAKIRSLISMIYDPGASKSVCLQIKSFHIDIYK